MGSLTINTSKEAGELVHQLGALNVLTEDSGLVHSTYMATVNHL